MNGTSDVQVSSTAEEPAADSWEIVHAIQRGDRTSFGVLYERHVRMLLRYFTTRGYDQATAEDLTSEVFVRALRRIDSVRYRGSDVGAWLVTIARNLGKDHLKASRSRQEVAVEDPPERGRSVAGPECQVLARIDLDEAAGMLRVLTDEQRDCLVLRRILGHSVKDTAARMNRSRAAIRVLLYRAVRRLDEAAEADETPLKA